MADQGRSAKSWEHLTDEAFVQRAYAALLRRSVDWEGLRHYLGRLRAGETRDRIWRSISESAEARGSSDSRPLPQMGLEALLALEGERFVEGAYAYVLGRPADRDGASHYGAALAAGQSRIDVLRALYQSSEARVRMRRLPELESVLASEPVAAKPARVVARAWRWLQAPR